MIRSSSTFFSLFSFFLVEFHWLAGLGPNREQAEYKKRCMRNHKHTSIFHSIFVYDTTQTRNMYAPLTSISINICRSNCQNALDSATPSIDRHGRFLGTSPHGDGAAAGLVAPTRGGAEAPPCPALIMSAQRRSAITLLAASEVW